MNQISRRQIEYSVKTSQHPIFGILSSKVLLLGELHLLELVQYLLVNFNLIEENRENGMTLEHTEDCFRIYFTQLLPLINFFVDLLKLLDINFRESSEKHA